MSLAVETPAHTQTKEQNQPQCSLLTKIDPGPHTAMPGLCWHWEQLLQAPPFQAEPFQVTLSSQSQPCLLGQVTKSLCFLQVLVASKKPLGEIWSSWKPNLPQSGAILTEFKILQSVGCWEEFKPFLGCPGTWEQLNFPHQKEKKKKGI